MASTSPLNVYENVRSIADEISLDWTGGKFGRWIVQYNVLAYALSAQHAPGEPVYDYYLVQLEGSAVFEAGSSSWHLDAHMIQTFPLDANGALRTDAELISHAPTTTIGATSYSTSMTTTIGGSVGFMGDSLTGSVSASVSTSSSKSYSIVDLDIEDMSLMSTMPPCDGNWAFEVANGSKVQSNDCPIAVAFLYRVPRGQPSFQVSIGYGVFLTGGDTGELGAMPEDPVVQVISGFVNSPNPWLNDKARLMTDKNIIIAAPPAPPALQ